MVRQSRKKVHSIKTFRQILLALGLDQLAPKCHINLFNPHLRPLSLKNTKEPITSLSLKGRSKLEYPEETHVSKVKNLKLHARVSFKGNQGPPKCTKPQRCPVTRLMCRYGMLDNCIVFVGLLTMRLQQNFILILIY